MYIRRPFKPNNWQKSSTVEFHDHSMVFRSLEGSRNLEMDNSNMPSRLTSDTLLPKALYGTSSTQCAAGACLVRHIKQDIEHENEYLRLGGVNLG